MFTFETRKKVKVHSNCLGLSYLFLILAVFAYIIVFRIMGKLGYVAFNPPAGASAEITVRSRTPAGCEDNPLWCEDNTTAFSDLHYCLSDNRDYIRGKVMNCTYLNPLRDSFGDGPISFGVATYIDMSTMSFNPKCGSPMHPTQTCKKAWDFYIEDDGEMFIADVEHATFGIDVDALWPDGSPIDSPSVLSSIYVEKGTEAQDKLCEEQSRNGDAWGDRWLTTATKHAPCYITGFRTTEHKALDLITPQLLLAAMGTKLDDNYKDGKVVNNQKLWTLRRSGFRAILVIHYENVPPWSFSSFFKGSWGKTVSKVYTPKIIATGENRHKSIGGDFEWQQVAWLTGMQFTISISGDLGEFSLATLLTTLTTGFALFATAAAVVENMATSVLPRRHFYKKVLVEEYEIDEKLDESHCFRGGDEMVESDMSDMPDTQSSSDVVA